MDARKLGLVAVWLVAAGCGGGTGNANTGAVSGANATAGGGSTAASGGATSAGGTGPDAWGPVEEVTPARRVSALDGVTDQWTRLSKLPDVAGRRKQMADYIVAQPEFRASGVEGTSIWGRFKDQRLVIIVDSPSWGATPGKQAPPAQPPHANAAPEAPRVSLAFSMPERSGVAMQIGNHGQVPAQGGALIVDALASEVSQSAATDQKLTDMLTASGYSVTTLVAPKVTVAGLQASINSNVGVLYMNTHGGPAWKQNPDGRGGRGIPTYTFMTNEPLSFNPGDVQSEQQYIHDCAQSPPRGSCLYEDMLRAGEMAYMKVSQGLVTWAYGVTDLFFKNHIADLAKHALVWLAVCESMKFGGAFSAQPMVDELEAKNAELVVGWSDAVAPGVGLGSALFGFDLLLGANAYPYDIETFVTDWGQQYPVANNVADFPLNPPARPFQWTSVYAALKAKGLASSVALPRPGSSDRPVYAALVYDGPPGRSDHKVLVPGITYIDVASDHPDTIVINGEFGDDPGRGSRNVYLTQVRPSAPSKTAPPDKYSWGDEIPYEDCAWMFNKVTCQLKGGLVRKAGWVRVIAQGHPSNPVPLTMWTPAIAWRQSDTTQEVDVTPVFRADIHQYRENAINPPRSRSPFPIVPSLAASTCHVNGLMQFLKAGKGVSTLDATFENSSWMKNILFLPATPQPPFHVSVVSYLSSVASPVHYGSCAAGGTFNPTSGEWAFNFGALFRAPNVGDDASNGRRSPGPSASAAAQAQQTVQGLAAAAGTGAGRSAPPAWPGGPSLPKDDPNNGHSPVTLGLAQYDRADKDFVTTAPPLLKIDPATPEARESAGKADFKAGDWRASLKSDPPHTTLGGFDGVWTGSYAPDDKTAR